MRFRSSSHQPTASDAVWHRRVLRMPGAVLGVILLMFQVLAPVMAQASVGGDWVVICSEFGVIEVQIPPSDTTPGNVKDCPECEACVLCVTSDQVITAQMSHVVLFVAATLSSGWAKHSVQSVNPAQYWPDCRGPPLASIIFKIRTGQVSLASIHDTGEAPCS